jgi:RNA polymerase sigma factor (sigma-70 family)
MRTAEPVSEQWLELVRRHDEAATRHLVEHLYPLVLKIARAHRPPRLAEEDLCQEVFMSVFADLACFRGQVPFEHWVARIAVNTCVDQLRRERSRPELRWADLRREEADALQSMMADRSERSAAHLAGTRELVSRLVDCLEPKDRLLIQWLELEERSVAEVSAWTGWGKSMIKVRAYRARRKMRRLLEQILQKERS